MTDTEVILDTAAPDPAQMAKALEIVTNDAKAWLQKAVAVIQDGGDANEAISALAVVEKKVSELETAISVSVEVVGALVQQRDEVIRERDEAREGAVEAFAEGYDEGLSADGYPGGGYFDEDPLEEVGTLELKEELESREAQDEGFVVAVLKQHGHDDDAEELKKKIQTAKAARDEVDDMLTQARDWYSQQGKLTSPPVIIEEDDEIEEPDDDPDEDDEEVD